MTVNSYQYFTFAPVFLQFMKKLYKHLLVYTNKYT